MCCGVYSAFGTDAAGFRELFPGLDVSIVVLDQNFKTPFLRDYVRVTCAYNSDILFQSPHKGNYSYEHFNYKFLFASLTRKLGT